MNRRYFFQQLASGLIAATAPMLFLPKIIRPGWKDTSGWRTLEPGSHWVDLGVELKGEGVSECLVYGADDSSRVMITTLVPIMIRSPGNKPFRGATLRSKHYPAAL
jgi:hypothetical protein